MARKEINVGTSPNKGDGDPLRTAFRKINENFAELYTGNFAEPDAITSTLAPDTDGTYDLGKSDKRWADLYVKDFIYLNGSRIELTSNGTLLINGGPPAERQDTVGSVFADDSTVMVDSIAGKVVGPVETTTVDAGTITATSVAANTLTGDLTGSVFADDSTMMIDSVTHTVNLNGTVRDHVIPSEDEQFDIGSPTNRFRDIYLKGSTIDLGGMRISNDGAGLQIATELEGGEVFAAGWWDTQWFKVGPFTSGPEIKVRIDDVPADTTNQAWLDFIRNIQPGDIFNIKTPVEQTLVVTSTVYEDHFSDTQFRYYFGVDVAPDIVGDDTYVYLVTVDSIPANNLRIKYTPSTADDWGFGSLPTNVSGALDLLADWITNRDITNISGSVFGDDSTLLVDGVNGKIVAPVETTTVIADTVSGDLTGNVIGDVTGNTLGSVFGEDSALLVDGINSSINLDGTIKGNIIPDANEAYDIGSMTHKFRDLYLSGSTINLGGLEITNDNGTITFGGEKVVVEGGTGDVRGSVFGDDSTLLVDAINSVIPKANVEDSGNWDAAFGWGDHSAAGYASQATTYTKAEVDTAISAPRDLKGSVFADDSTLLVDGANGVIPTSVLQGDITNPIRTGNVVIESTTSPGSVTITHAGIGGITIDASTSADGISLEGNVSVEGSFTPPMLTQVEIDALTPTLGMMVYNTTTGKFQGYAADANNDSTTGWADLH